MLAPAVRRFWLLGLLGAGLAHRAAAQAPAGARAPDPLHAQFYTQDVQNFWRAYDADAAGDAQAFATYYWRPASAGARVLLEKNGLPNADSLRALVARRRADYARVRPQTLRLAGAVPACRAAYRALQNLYPAATFPPVYFAVGGFGVGGNSVPAGQLIGAEMNAPANVPPLVAHEVVHAQQQIPYKYRVLLEQCLIEGSADFLGELISGRLVNRAPYDYARGREKPLWAEFVRDQNLGENDSFAAWLYNTNEPRPGGRAPDLGYYIGYQIAKAYYDRAPNKRRAVEEMLHIADCRQFLQRSHYADRFR